MNKHSTASNGYLLVAVGIGLIVIGLSWKQLVPAKTFWTEEDAKAYAVIAEAAHAASFSDDHDHSHDHGHDHSFNQGVSQGVVHGAGVAADSREDKTPREQFELARESLIQAKSAHSRWGQYLSALGAITAFAGMLIIRRNN